MSFPKLYEHVASLRHRPIIIDRDVVPFILDNTSQDEIFFVGVDLDPEISLGHIKQYREASGVYDRDPKWVSQIRYHKNLNKCWQRYVCCKELMHIFDTEDQQTNSADKFTHLLDELEATPLFTGASQMFLSETVAKWMAMAVLCPLPSREDLKPRWRTELSDYEVALELRIPESCVPAIMGDSFEEFVSILLKM